MIGDNFKHIGSIPDGHLVYFPNCDKAFMKVCGIDGVGGVVEMKSGLFLRYIELERLFKVDITKAVDYYGNYENEKADA